MRRSLKSTQAPVDEVGKATNKYPEEGGSVFIDIMSGNLDKHKKHQSVAKVNGLADDSQYQSRV